MWSKVFGYGLSAAVGVVMMVLPETGWLPQESAKFVFWIGATIAAICILGMGCSAFSSVRRVGLMLMPAWRVEFDGMWPFHRLVSVHEATHIAYPKIRNRLDLQVLESMEDNSNNMPSVVAQILLNNPGFKIPLYGAKAPFTSVEEIPAEDAEQFMFSGDAKELVDQYNENKRYTNVAMRRRDLNRRIVELRG